jgi:hypothetical protein
MLISRDPEIRSFPESPLYNMVFKRRADFMTYKGQVSRSSAHAPQTRGPELPLMAFQPPITTDTAPDPYGVLRGGDMNRKRDKLAKCLQGCAAGLCRGCCD